MNVMKRYLDAHIMMHKDLVHAHASVVVTVFAVRFDGKYMALTHPASQPKTNIARLYIP